MLKINNVSLNRKILSEIAANDNDTFQAIVKKAANE